MNAPVDAPRSPPSQSPRARRARVNGRQSRYSEPRLTARQLIYAGARAAGLSGVESATRAGYGKTLGSAQAAAVRLDGHPLVAAEVRRRIEAAGMVTDPKAVLRFVSMKAQDSTRDRDQLRAAELMGKYHALWQDVIAVRDLPRDPARLRDLIEVEILRVLGIEGIRRLAQRVEAQLAAGTLQLPAPRAAGNVIEASAVVTSAEPLTSPKPR